MNGRIPAEVFPPGEFIREELEARGWTVSDLADLLREPRQLIDEIVSGERAVTPELANGLGDTFGTGPEFWMNLESSYRDSLMNREDDPDGVRIGAESRDALTPPTNPTALRG